MQRILTFSVACLMAGTSWAQAPNISYPQSSYSFPIGTAIGSLTPSNTGGAPFLQTGVVTNFAGNGIYNYADGAGVNASFRNPAGVAMDANGTIYVADQNSHRIRKINSSGVVSAFVGGGSATFVDGSGTVARFNSPAGVAVDGSGNVYVADRVNNRIRKATPAGLVSTLAGGATAGLVDGAGTAARFNQPAGVAVDANGNVYVADLGNHCIRKVTPQGVVSTLAGSGSAAYADGTGTSASFRSPSGVALDGNLNLYVADAGNQRIRKVSAQGVVTTIAGSGVAASNDGLGTAAGFNNPAGIAVDANGNIYVSDAYNNRIRKISPAGVVTTLAGNSCTTVLGGITFGCFADGTGSAASFNFPAGLLVDGNGIGYVADFSNNRIRKFTQTSTGAYSVNPALPAGLSLDASTGAITGTPTGETPATNYVVSAVNASGISSYTINIATGFAPFIASVDPATVFPGTTVTISGGPFTGATAVTFGGVAATSFSVVNNTTITAVVGNGASGSVHVTTPFGTATMPGFTFNPPPAITSLSPANTYCSGGQLAINVSASGYDPTNVFTAQLSDNTGSFSNPTVLGTLTGSNGGVITGTIPAGQPTGTGYRIRVVSSNPILEGMDNGTNLMIYALPTAAQAQISASGATDICQGSSVNFTVPFSNAFTYQWKLNGVAISGATDTAYAASAAGVYDVSVSNAAGCSVNSGSQSVTVVTAPVATISPNTSQSYNGTPITLAANTGSGLTYQWMLGGNMISGATTDTYQATAGGSYTVVVKNAQGCSVTSAPTLISDIPTITNINPAAIFCRGAQVAITFSAAGFESNNVFTAQLSSGSGSFSNPVNLGTLNGGNGGIITATIPVGQPMGLSYRIRIVASNPGIIGPNNGTNIAIYPSPSVTISPSSPQSICPGGTATLTAGSGLIYQWLLDGTAISGATAKTYVASTTGNYSLKATNSLGCSITTPAVAVTPKNSCFGSPAITSVIPATNICAGAVVSIDFNAAGFDPANVFTAQLSNASGTFTGGVSNIGTLNSTSGGTITASIPVSAASGSNYRIRIRASSPATVSANNGFGLTIKAMPTVSDVTISPSGTQYICAGSNGTLSVPGNGSCQYQWFNAGAPIVGETGNSYVTNMAGSYSVQVINAGGCERLSGNKLVVVNSVPLGTFAIANIAGSSNKRLTAIQSSANSYQWFLNGNPIAGETNRVYIAPVSGSYHVVVSRNGCTTTGLPVFVNISSAGATREVSTENLGIGTQVTMGVYPNPSASDAKVLIHAEAAGTWKVRIMDIAGRVVSEMDVETNLEARFGELLAPGMYTLEATNGHERIVQKWVKE